MFNLKKSKLKFPYIIFAIFIFIMGCADNQTVEKKIHKINQDPLSYVKNDALPINQQQQQLFLNDFIKRYFSPWADQGVVISVPEVLREMQQNFKNYEKNPGWGENNHPIEKIFIENLIAKANLAIYPNVNKPGIIVESTFVRSLPTLLPSFGNPKAAGEGYPFDNIQESYIERGTPIRVLHRSRDGRWYLINTPSYYGWVLSQNVGFVSQDFITQWKQHPFVVAMHDRMPLFSENQLVMSSSRIGILYPMTHDDEHFYTVAVPFLDDQGNAQIKTLLLEKKYSHPFPMSISTKNIAALAKNMMGSPYGWGGIYSLRDCSATTKDLLADFGVWLPRNSLLQIRVGQAISFKNMSSMQKLATIKNNAIPFLTLIHAPGHITLYVGTIDNKVYVLQDVWGLHTFNILDREGRAIIGKTVITPIDFGKNFINVQGTLLERVDGMSVLSPTHLYGDNKS